MRLSAHQEVLMNLEQMMNFRNIIYTVLCTCLVNFTLHAQDSLAVKGTSCIPVRTLERENLAFMGGEKMSFVMHYEWGVVNSDVGHATVSLDSLKFNGEDAYHCKVQGKTTKLFDLFFKVREDFQSWFTCDGLRPLKFTRNTFEGRYEARNTYFYDWSAEEPHIDALVYSSSKGERNIDIPLTRCTYDLPALFFFARNMDLDVVTPGRKYPMTFVIDDDVFNVYFILYGPETIDVKGFGTVKTIKFAAKLLEGEVFKGEEDMMIWVTDDDNRLPVYFEAPLRVGTASGRMTGCSGLKYPFTALIEK